MTVNTISSIAEFDTNGVTTNFPFFFKFLANEDLVVTYVDPLGVSSTLNLGTHYTVNGAGNDQGGSIVTTSALAGPGQLVVSREMDAFQQTSLRNQGKFLAETHEDVFDKLTMLIQQGFAVMRRALLKPIGKNYYDAQASRIANVQNPSLPQDAATMSWSQSYISSILNTGQGPINNAANVLYSTVANQIRTVKSKLDDIPSIKDFGAIGDGVDDTVAFELAMSSGIREIYIPPGRYMIKRSLSSSIGIHLVGAGPANSRLYFEGCDGFSLTPTGRGDNIIFQDLAVLAVSRAMYTAVRVHDQNLTRRTPAAIFIDCAFTGADVFEQNATWPGETQSNIQEWKIALDLVSAYGSLVEKCSFVGKGEAITVGFDTGTTAIAVGQAMHATLQRNFFTLIKYGVTVGMRSEGMRILDCQFVGMHTGLTNMVGVGTILSPNNFVVDNSHFDTTWRGIEFGLGSDSTQVGLNAFSNILFLRRGLTPGYVAIDALMSRSTVTNNVIQTNASIGDFIADGSRGIVISGTENVVSGNIGRNCGYLVELTATSARNFISGNSHIRAGTAVSRLCIDNGTSNVIGQNAETNGSSAGKLFSGTSQRLHRGDGLGYNIEAKTGSGTSTYDARLEFSGGTSVDGEGNLGIRAGSITIIAPFLNTSTVRPNADNTSSLGASGLRYSQVFAATGTINTSDLRDKQVSDIEEAEYRVCKRIKFLKYKFLDSLNLKGDGARWHFGVGAQQVKEAFEAEGLDAFQYGILCYDEWPEIQVEYEGRRLGEVYIPATHERDEVVLYSDVEMDVTPDGAEWRFTREIQVSIKPSTPAGNRYGVRYDELLCLMMASLNRV